MRISIMDGLSEEVLLRITSTGYPVPATGDRITIKTHEGNTLYRVDYVRHNYDMTNSAKSYILVGVSGEY